MIEKLESFFGFFRNMATVRDDILSNCPDQNAHLTREHRELLKDFARSWRELFHRHGFDSQEEYARDFLTNRVFTYSAAVARLHALEDSFRRAIKERLAYVLKADGQSYISSAGFGEAVRQSFPSAQSEIDTARMCYALGQPTACVFHLMRSVEHLLRAFVVAVGVKQSAIPLGVKQKKEIPLEYQMWDQLIRQAEEKINDRLNQKSSKPLSKWKSKAAGETAKSTLRASIADFYSFKDNVRNSVMHTRSGLLDEPTAKGIMDRVQRCFERLAPYLSEGKKRSLFTESCWTKAGTGKVTG